MSSKRTGKAQQAAISRKIRKIEHEGIRGRKVSHKQAVAAAINMVRKGYHG